MFLFLSMFQSHLPSSTFYLYLSLVLSVFYLSSIFYFSIFLCVFQSFFLYFCLSIFSYLSAFSVFWLPALSIIFYLLFSIFVLIFSIFWLHFLSSTFITLISYFSIIHPHSLPHSTSCFIFFPFPSYQFCVNCVGATYCTRLCYVKRCCFRLYFSFPCGGMFCVAAASLSVLLHPFVLLRFIFSCVRKQHEHKNEE